MKYLISILIGVSCFAQVQLVTSTQKKFFSTSDPGIVTNSRAGDIFFNTSTRNIWTCANPTSFCTAIGVANWTQITWNYTPLNPANNLSDVERHPTAKVQAKIDARKAAEDAEKEERQKAIVRKKKQ